MLTVGWLCMCLPLLAAGSEVIDSFDAGVDAWAPTMQYGDASRCRADSGEGAEGTPGLCIDYDLAGPETNHIVYQRDVELDLSFTRGVSFQVRGEGEPVSLFLFVYDSQGRFRNYGPHGSNPDFTSGYAEWQTLAAEFDRDRSVQGGDADLTDIRKIGWMLWHMGPAKGRVCLDDLRAVDAEGSLGVTPLAITPNGDGVADTMSIVVRAPRGAEVTVEILDQDGKSAALLAPTFTPDTGRVRLSWDGSGADGPLPPARYTVAATIAGEAPQQFLERVTLNQTEPWPPVSYELEPFFPMGVWFEGAPSMNGAPADPEGAKAYYDRCFADLAAHGFNAAAVPNCPEQLWETLLQSAQEHGIKVALEVGPLVRLVSSEGAASEFEVAEAAQAVHERLGKYESLLRYQIRDEPPRDLVDNWLLVRRILAAVDPRRPAFSCFCHPDSLALVTDRAPLSEAVIDIYPHHGATPPQTLGGFLSTLETFQASIKDNDWWAVLQAFGVPDPASWRYPTAEELSAVTYLSLAAGAKGVFYFIYQYMPDYLWGMVAADGTPQPIYEPASQLAQELQQLAPLLQTLKKADSPAPAEGEARTGSFVGPEGQRVLIVASTRPDARVTAWVWLGAEGVWEDALTGEQLMTQGPSLRVPLEPGRGRVLKQVP